MCNITILQNEIKAVAHAMGAKDVREYLNGVMIETNGADFHMVATDGARLHVVTGSCGEIPTQPVTQYIIPALTVKTIVKAKAPRSNSGPALICLTLGDGKVAARLPDGTETVATLIEGRYPDHRRVIPTELGDQIPATYNPGYVLDAFSGLDDFLGRKALSPLHAMYQRGDSAGVLSHGRYTAIVMPIRSAVLTPCAGVDPAIHARLASPMQAKAA